MPNILRSVRNLPKQSCLIVVLVPMVAAAIILRVVLAFVPSPRPDLLPDADGMVERATVEDAQAHTTMRIATPDDALGGEVYMVGVYTAGGPSLAVGSAAVVLVRDKWRLAEIVGRPGVRMEDVRDAYRIKSDETVTLGQTTATLLRLETTGIPCVNPDEKWELPGFCEIDRVLIFARGEDIVSVAADSPRLTDGELFTLARDILE